MKCINIWKTAQTTIFRMTENGEVRDPLRVQDRHWILVEQNENLSCSFRAHNAAKL